MTALEAIKILKTDMGCYECTVGCSNPYRCANDACPFREAIHLAVEKLSIDVLPKMINTEPQTEMEKSGSRAVQTARCLNCHNAKACKENDWKVCRYDPWKLTAVENEPQTMHYSQVDGITPSVIVKTEPKTDQDFKVTYTCSFTDCDNFKNFGFSEKCIECKRKQSEAKYKTEPQTEVNALYDQIVEDIDTRVKCVNAKKVENEPQTEYKILREQCRAFMGIVEQTERSEE